MKLDIRQYDQFNSPSRKVAGNGEVLTVKQWAKRFIGTVGKANAELLREMTTGFTPDDAAMIEQEFFRMCDSLVRLRGFILPEFNAAEDRSVT